MRPVGLFYELKCKYDMYKRSKQDTVAVSCEHGNEPIYILVNKISPQGIS
jgi:hypothetical protein